MCLFSINFANVCTVKIKKNSYFSTSPETMMRDYAKLPKTHVFWDVTRCRSVSGVWHFRGTQCLHLQGSTGPWYFSCTHSPVNIKVLHSRQIIQTTHSDTGSHPRTWILRSNAVRHSKFHTVLLSLLVSLGFTCHCSLISLLLTHCGQVTQICVFNMVKLGTSASSP